MIPPQYIASLIIFIIFTFLQFGVVLSIISDRLYEKRKTLILSCIPVIGPIILLIKLIYNNVKFPDILTCAKEIKDSVKEFINYIKSLE